MTNLTKILLSAAVAAAATSCGLKSGYSITGSAQGAADGDSVFLIDATSHLNIDTAIISGGVFSFTGKADTARYAFLQVEKAADGGALACPLYLEDGDITVRIAEQIEESSATGTKCNDATARLKAEFAKVTAAVDSLEQLAQNPSLTPEQSAAYANQAETLYDSSYLALYKQAAASNISTVAGVHFLEKVSYLAQLHDLDSLLCLVPPAYHHDAAYVKLADKVARMKTVDIGMPFLDFALPSINGDTLRLSSFMDGHKVVLIDFWASWCGPCCREMPNMVRAYDRFKDKGLEIVGVSQDADAEAWRNSVSDMGMTWPQLSALRRWDNEAIKLYAINSIPNTVIIKDGIIVAHNLTGEKLIDKLAQLLEQ